MNSRASSTDRCEGEISVLDIVRFLGAAWKAIALTGLCGLAISAIYLFFAPRIYEAKAQIVLNQIASTTQFSYQGIAIEDAAKLINRVSHASLTPKIMSACDENENFKNGNAQSFLQRHIKLSASPSGLVDLIAYGSSREAAINCATTFFEFIKDTQAQLAEPYFINLRARLVDDEARLEKLRSFMNSSNGMGDSSKAAFYLLNLDEIRQIQGEIGIIRRLLNSSANQATHLNSPIYASSTPIAPRRFSIVMIGLFGGFLFGLIGVLGRQVFINLKNSRGH